jgi:hypothetical protein
MAITTLNSYVDVQKFITGILKANGEDASGSPHKNFWTTLSYTQFVTGTVPGVNDPNTGKPTIPILIKGNSEQSNIILALQGAAGTPFDPNTGAFGQMPADGPPMFTPDQIQSIADWIDRGCPQ